MRLRQTLFWISFLFAMAIVFFIHMQVGNAGDKQWFLLAARMWLEGKRLYTDIVEVNPPLIVWIYAIPVFISFHLSWLKDYVALIGIAGTCIAISIYVSFKLISEHPEFRHDVVKKRQWIVLTGIVLLVCVLPGHFFDREHIFLVLTFPYIMRWMPSLSMQKFSPALLIVTGTMAAVGFCIKPYCFLIFIAIQAMYVMRHKSFSIFFGSENAIIYAVTVCYLAAILLLYPFYVHFIIPMALLTYSAIYSKMETLKNFAITFLMFSIPLADFRLRYTSPYRSDIYYFLGLCAACLLYIFANNWWPYTFVPLNSMILVMTAFLGWEYRYLRKTYAANGQSVRLFIFGERACLINFAFNLCLALAVLYLAITRPEGSYFARNEVGRQYWNDAKAAGSFGTVTGDFSFWAALSAQSGARWQTRFNNPWMLPKFFASDAQFARKNHWIVDYVSDSLAKDMNNNKPNIMFIDDIYVYPNITLLAYLNSFSSFHAAWQHYRYSHSINECVFPATLPAVTYNSHTALVSHCRRRDVYERLP